MAEKHLTKITTRSLGPTPARFTGNHTDHFPVQQQPPKKAENKQYIMPLEEDYPNLKIVKQALPNPVLSYKGHEYYQALTNKLKMNKTGANNVSHSLSYGFGEITEIKDLSNNRKESPGAAIIEDESPSRKIPEIHPEKLHKQQSFGALPNAQEEPRASPPFPKPIPQSNLQGSRMEGKGVTIVTRKSRRRQDAAKKLPALDETRTGITIVRKRNEPSYYEYSNSFTGNESARMIHNISAQKIKQSHFYQYVRCKSPSSLLNKYPRLRKESDFYQQIPNSVLPYAEMYNEIASKILTGKKVLTVNRDPSPLDYNMRSSDPQTPNMGRKGTGSTKNTWEMMRERTPESLLAPLVISGVKKGSRHSPTRMGRNEAETGLSKINIHELTNHDTTQTEEDNGNNKTSKEVMGVRMSTLERGNSVLEEVEEKAGGEGEGEEKQEEGENLKGSDKVKKVENGHRAAVETSRKSSYVNTLKNSVKKPGALVKQQQLSSPEQVFKEFLLRVNFSFGVQIKMPQNEMKGMYKFYLGKGNNHVMIRALMKTRWWWSQTDSKNHKEINFMWTQCRNKKFIESLPTKEQLQSEQEKGAAKNNLIQTRRGSTGAAADYAMDLDPSLKGVVTDGYKRLFTKKEIEIMEGSVQGFRNGVNGKEYEELCKKKLGSRFKQITDPHNRRMCNHIEDNFHLANKKALLINMRNYYASINDDVFKHLPLTFHIKNGLQDEEYTRFVECYKQRERENQEQDTDEKGNKTKKLRNIWIVKPGEDTNKGKGISLINDISDVRDLIVGTRASHGSRTLLIQLYLDRPLLYNKRKFDIRCYMLISCINGVYKGYWYQEGYFRTSSKEFTLKNISNKQIHLTNDAIQKKYEEYGKWEAGNKVSYSEFEKYLESTYGGSVDFYKHIYPQMKQSATDTIRAVYGTVDPYKRENTFEVFGLDFMIDANYHVWLIEVNTNPDITIPSPKLSVLIPTMVENALRLTIDPMFPPPPSDNSSKKQAFPENPLENNKFELVFDEVEEGHILKSTLKSRQEALNTLSPEDREGEEENEEDAND